MGSPISAVYAATKGAVQAWTRSAAQAWAADKITVNALAPAVQTPGADRLRDFLGPEAGALIDQQLQMRIPLGGTLGDPRATSDPCWCSWPVPARASLPGNCWRWTAA